MATPTADKLRAYFPSKYVAADGNALTEQTADAGGSVTTIVDSALVEADDYWNGAVGWFEGDTTTAALRSARFHVKDFTASTDTLTLYQDLPGIPVAGDTYRLALGGSYRSSMELRGMNVGGNLPEEKTITGTNITGLTVKKASANLGTGTLTVFYDKSADELFIKMDGSYGVALDVSGNLSDAIVFTDDGESWLQVTTVAASLPAADQTDTWTLSYPERTFTPDFEGYESTNGNTRYRLEVIKNTGTDQMVDLKVYSSVPSGAATTIASGESLTTAVGNFDVVSASGWPTKSFWVENTTANDCRYVYYRSGNTLYCAAGVTYPGRTRGYTSTSWAATNAIRLMPDVDLGLDAPAIYPATGQFENPSTENTSPVGVTFDNYRSSAPLTIGNLAAGAIYGVWRSEVIIIGHHARSNVDMDSHYLWS